MANLQFSVNQTMAAIDEAMESEQDTSTRPYLGMSGLGQSCAKKTWFDFRWATPKRMKASSIKAIQDGFAGEDVMAKRLRLVSGVSLLTANPNTGEQFGFVSEDGHVKGHMDGAIIGILEAPKTWHVWEHKQVNETKFNKLQNLVSELGEKEALQKWDETYYGQAQCYMGFSGMHRHFLTVASPGGRAFISVRTEFKKEKFDFLMDKANRIVNAATPPDGISADPTYYECKWCDHKELCHGSAAPVPTCRSCAHSTPVAGGEWECHYYAAVIPTVEAQKAGCEQHRIIPIMLKNWAEPIDASEADNWVKYQVKSAQGTFTNGNPATFGDHISSKEVYAVVDKRTLVNPRVIELRNEFAGSRLVA